MKNLLMFALGAASMTAMAGCATPSESAAAPAAGTEVDALAGSATIYNTNSVGTWSATAYAPYMATNGGATAYDSLTAQASFTGPAGQTRKMGLCLIQMTGTPCTFPTSGTALQKQTSINTQCANSPTSIPTGGSRYCLAYNNAGQTYCGFRAGPQNSNWCAGSPGISGNPPVAPGTYKTVGNPWVPAGVPHVTDACFEGCGASDPSVSSDGAAASDPACYDQYGHEVLCGPI